MDNRIARHALLAALLVGLGSLVAYAQQVEMKPADLKWVPIPAIPGAQRALMLGDSTKPGPYVHRVRFPPKFKHPAHSHSDNRNYTVISGIEYVGIGDKFDAAKLKAHAAGTFSTYVANTNHFSATKDKGCIIQISGMGPSELEYVDPKDDPRKKQ